MSADLEQTIVAMVQAGPRSREWERLASGIDFDLVRLAGAVATVVDDGVLALGRIDGVLRRPEYFASLRVVDKVFSDGSTSYVEADRVTSKHSDSPLATLYEAAEQVVSAREQAARDAHAREIEQRRSSAVAELGGG